MLLHNLCLLRVPKPHSNQCGYISHVAWMPSIEWSYSGHKSYVVQRKKYSKSCVSSTDCGTNIGCHCFRPQSEVSLPIGPDGEGSSRR